ncbi:MAG: NYN domain-containing protein [Pseudomonadota bacterium]
MRSKDSGSCLSAVFVDYDNIYMSLKRKSEDAARAFANDTQSWYKQIELGKLITPTNGFINNMERRLVMSRCYGNPVPRRNGRDNSTDMNSFPFVRHHFLRSGFEIIDCPPLTAQLKNSSDIRMVMDIRDFLDHNTYFDEFIILSGDADFTPVLHRLRSHARRTIIFANDYTATPYTAICDGEIREADLVSFLTEGAIPDASATPAAIEQNREVGKVDQVGQEIMDEVLKCINSSDKAVPIAYLADRAQRTLGHDKTIGTNWAGFGAFRSFLMENLPKSIKLSDSPPYYVLDPNKHALTDGVERPLPKTASVPTNGSRGFPVENHNISQTVGNSAPIQTAPSQHLPSAGNIPASTAGLQKSIARIHEASQIPPLAPPDYRTLFQIMAQELSEKGLNGGQTISGIVLRASQYGLELNRDDVQFLLDVVSEADPWFEQGISPDLFAGRVRNYVVAKCRQNGLQLMQDELELIEAWFIGVPAPDVSPEQHSLNQLKASLEQQARAVVEGGHLNVGNQIQSDLSYDLDDNTQFPRIVRQHM